MSDEREHEVNEQTVDRRRLLRRAGTVAAGVAGAGVVTAVAATPAQATDGSPVIQGQTNAGGATSTTLSNNSLANATLTLDNNGVDADGFTGPGLQLAPSGGGLTSTAPAGAVSADAAGVLWNGMNFSGTALQGFVYNNFIANMVVPLSNPQRVLDTRSGAGRANIINPSGNLDSSGRLLGGHTIHIDLGAYVFAGTAFFGNLTVVAPTANGFLTVFPFGTTRPNTSNINFSPKVILSNSLVVGIGWDPADFDPLDAVSIYAHVTTHVILDAMAFAVGSADQVAPGLAMAGAAAGSKLEASRAARQALGAKKVRQLRAE